MQYGALNGITVIDLCRSAAGAYCCKLMAGFGARVIMIEPPGKGSPLRQMGPFLGGDGKNEQSIHHLWLNTGKESIAVDLKTADGVSFFYGLLRKADILVHDYPLTDWQHLGIDHKKISKEIPELIITSISPFGCSGPYKEFTVEEIQLQAMSGMMHLTGDPDKEPLAAGPSVCHYTAALHAYTATLLALFQKTGTGRGQHVEVSMHEACLENIEIALTNALHCGKKSQRGPHLGVPWSTYKCRDGFAVIISLPARNWCKAEDVLECPALFEKKYQHILGRIADRGKYERLLDSCLQKFDKKQLFHQGQKRGLAFGYVASLGDFLKSPHLAARKFFCQIGNPAGEDYLCADAPFFLSKTPWKTAKAPLLDEHRKAVYEGLRTPAPADKKPGKIIGSDNLPLYGLRVIDLSHSWAGPHAARILADFGAEVIKVEYPKRLCLLRGARKDEKHYDKHPAWHQVNRNKRSVTLDFTREADRDVLTDLLRGADVLIENSRPGVMKRLGFAYEDVVRFQHDIIMLSMSALGATGPYSSYSGYGAVFEALSGIQSLTSYSHGQPPKRIKELDVTNGITGAVAVLTALAYRNKTGEGQYIDLSQLEVAAHTLIGEHLLYCASCNEQFLAGGNRHWFFAPQGCYPCRGQDKWITITIRSNKEWRIFCQTLEKPEWVADQRFLSRRRRKKNQDELDRLIADCTRVQDHKDLMCSLQEQGIAAGAVFDTEELVRDVHLEARGYYVDSAGNPSKRFMGFPFRLAENPTHIERQGPDLGQDNEFVICRQLGRSRSSLKEFSEEQIGTAFDIH